MNRFSIQRVSDKEVNSVLMQVQDALNALVDAMTVVQPVTKTVAQLKNLVSANRAFGMSDTPALRMILPAGQWTRVNFPGTYSLVPNHIITCYAYAELTTDYNRKVYFKVATLDNTGFVIKPSEQCAMQLEVFSIGEQTTGITSQYVEQSQ